jgi:hypothetical protein
MRGFVACLLVVVSVAPAGAQVSAPLGAGGQAGKEELPWIKLTVSPMAAPKPALRYQLLPELRDVKPGNAALLYQRAHAPDWFSSFRRHADYDKYYDWLELPLEKFPKSKAESLLPKQTLEEVDRAARRTYCDWELVERLRKDGLGLLIPDVQALREYGALLRLRARVEVLDGRFDKAVHTLQTGYSLGRHTGDGPTLIQALVGVAIVAMMNQSVEDLIQQPRAPNLYWALTDLPRPLVDMRKPLQGERIMVEALLPGLHDMLRDAKSRPLSKEEIVGYLDRIAALVDRKGSEFRLSAAVVSASMYPAARKYLIAQGRKAEEVDALPVVQTALLYAAGVYEERFDELRKWQSLPYWQAREALARVERDIRAKRAEGFNFGTIIADLMIPAVQKVVFAGHRLERKIAALRIVEALRLHAAVNGGKLPNGLADVREAPIPLDPVTGKEFTYKRDGSRAYVSAPPPPGEVANEANTIHYEITLRGGKN